MSGGGRASDIDGVREKLLVTEPRPQEVRWANGVVPQVIDKKAYPNAEPLPRATQGG